MKIAVIIIETHTVLCTLKRLHWQWSINICFDQPTDHLWSIRPWSERLPKCFTQITTISETSSFCHVHVNFHSY